MKLIFKGTKFEFFSPLKINLSFFKNSKNKNILLQSFMIIFFRNTLDIFAYILNTYIINEPVDEFSSALLNYKHVNWRLSIFRLMINFYHELTWVATMQIKFGAFLGGYVRQIYIHQSLRVVRAILKAIF
jgi:hypothetical protein